MCRVDPEISNQLNATLSGQDDLLGALEARLGYSDLIRNISSMQWNMEVQPTSNYSLEMALHVYIKIRS